MSCLILGRFSLLPLLSRLLNDRLSCIFTWICKTCSVYSIAALKSPLSPDHNFEFYNQTFTSSFFRTIIFKIAARETNKKSMMPWKMSERASMSYDSYHMLHKGICCTWYAVYHIRYSEIRWRSIPANVATLIPSTSPAAPPTSAKNFSNP